MSELEDGLRTGVENERNNSRGRGLEANVKLARANLASTSGGARRTTGQDTPEARFRRLIEIAREEAESLDWIDIVDPDTDLADVGYGVMLAGQADFYVPRMVRILATERGGGGDLARTIDLMDRLEPLADLFNLDKQGMPDKGQREAVRSVVDGLGASLVAVGEFDESEWKIAGQLDRDHMRAEVEGPANFVGKVSKQWHAGEGRHLLALPGTTLLPRRDRRALERKKPDDPDDDSFLSGPALMLDLLAVWR